MGLLATPHDAQLEICSHDGSLYVLVDRRSLFPLPFLVLWWAFDGTLVTVISLGST